jgi:hypothetical protein
MQEVEARVFQRSLLHSLQYYSQNQTCEVYESPYLYLEFREYKNQQKISFKLWRLVERITTE